MGEAEPAIAGVPGANKANMAIIVRMIVVPLVKPPELDIVEWFSQQWQADMKINTTERTYETGLSVSDEMRDVVCCGARSWHISDLARCLTCVRDAQ